MSRSYDVRFAGMSVEEIRTKLVKRLGRVGLMTTSQYTELVCDVGEFNRMHPGRRIVAGKRKAEKPRPAAEGPSSQEV